MLSEGVGYSWGFIVVAMYGGMTISEVSRYFVHSSVCCGSHQGVCNISIPCCVHIIFVLC